MKKVFVQLESGRGYGRDLLKGIYDYSHQYSGWEIIFEPAYYLKANTTSKTIDMIELMKPDGCILEHISDIDELQKLKIPFIQANWFGQKGGFPYLKGNYKADGQLAANYFQSLGYTNMGFFGVANLAWSDGRFKSFKKQALKKGGNVFTYINPKKRKKGFNYDLSKIVKWLKNLPKPIGILCCNDDLGQILINACSLGGLKVPHEIAVLGIDNDELLCTITFPNLSSIARNHTKAAFNACEVLNMMMNGQKIKDLVIPTQPLNVIARASTDSFACNDTEVVKALQYIKSNIYDPIQVTDVVAETYLSRRSLYSRFKIVTGNTINQEIQFQKMTKFKELLSNQNLSIKEIAFKLGFNDVSHVSRWFTSKEGTSPKKWREQNF